MKTRFSNLTQLGLTALLSIFLLQCGSDSKVITDDSDSTRDDSDTTDLDSASDSADDSETGDGDTASDSEEITTDEGDSDTEGDSETEEAEVVLLIDDFEDGDSVSLLGTNWYGYTDVDNDGLSELLLTRDEDENPVMDGEGYESERSLGLSYTLDQGDYEYDPYVGWGINLGDETVPFDGSSYSGISYMYRGSAHYVQIETLNVTDYDYYKVKVKASTEWREAVLPFLHFAQDGWGEPQDFDLSIIHNISWQAKGKTGDAGQLEIDNVGCLGANGVDIEPDMTIEDPAEPEKKELETITIENPLQALAMNSLNKGTNITNWLEQEKFEDFTYDEEYVTALAAAGYKALRLPIDLDQYIVDRDTYFDGTTDFAIEDVLFEILDSFDTWTLAAGMSLTIDYHQYDNSMDMADPLYVEAVIKLWTAVAEHFSLSTREDLFFELMNEPELSSGTNSVDADEWHAFAQQIIDGIRTVDTTHTILYGSVSWNSISALLKEVPFADDKVVYLFHFYEPFVFTHQGAAWSGMGTTHGIPYPYSTDRWSEYSLEFGFIPSMEKWQLDQLKNYYKTGNKTWLYNNVAPAKEWAVTNNVPVIINEFGVYERTALHEDIVRYYTDLVAVLEELEIPWTSWFMLMDAETGEMDADLKEAFGL